MTPFLAYHSSHQLISLDWRFALFAYIYSAGSHQNAWKKLIHNVCLINMHGFSSIYWITGIKKWYNIMYKRCSWLFSSGGVGGDYLSYWNKLLTNVKKLQLLFKLQSQTQEFSVHLYNDLSLRSLFAFNTWDYSLWLA